MGLKMKKIVLLILGMVCFFCNNLVAMKTPPRLATESRIPGSEKKAKFKASNICRKIIAALNRHEKKTALNLFHDFYLKIPAVMKNSSRREFHTGTFETDYRKYHLSMFFIFAMCLAHSAEVESSDINLRGGIKFDREKISLKLKTTGEIIYLVEFLVTSVEDNNVKMFVKINKTDDGDDSEAIDISEGYEHLNCFKNTVAMLVPAFVEDGDEAYFENEVLAAKLAQIMNAIPRRYRVHQERFYHFMIYSLVGFMGSYICDAEYYAGLGRADLILRTTRFIKGEKKLKASVIEVKINEDAKTAVDQGVNEEYANCVSDATVPILGISFYRTPNKKRVIVYCDGEVIKLQTPRYDADENLVIESSMIERKVKAQAKETSDEDEDKGPKKRKGASLKSKEKPAKRRKIDS